MTPLCLYAERIVVMGVALGWKRCRRPRVAGAGFCVRHGVGRGKEVLVGR